MEFSTKVSPPDKYATDCIVVGIHEGRALSAGAAALDRASKGELSRILDYGDMEGQAGTTRLLYRLPGLNAERVLLLGLGSGKTLDAKTWRNCITAAVRALNETGVSDAAVCLSELAVSRRDTIWKARHFVMAAAECLYRFDQMKSVKKKTKALKRLVFLTPSSREGTAALRGINQGRAIASGMRLARDLGNLPGNICTPTYLAGQASRMAEEWKLECQILETKDMAKLGMGSLLSVAKGSRQPPKLIELRYNGAGRREKPIVLIGKGITFDTGGISLKPGAEMDEMKFDMCGAASVLGTMRALAEMRLRLNVVALVPAAENMPDGAASKPGDIVTSLSGQTIEILNTDAEGRLILCDALTYAERFEPQAVVDIATLTGACIVALGHVCSGLFSNKEALARELQAAGEESWDRVWQLPLWDDYQDQLKSNFADFANIGGRAAGSVTAACFLSRFAGKFDWAHLDIAGTAWRSGKDKGASGRPVPLLTRFLMQRAEKGR